MAVDESLVEAAKGFVAQRFAASASWVGAAAVRTRAVFKGVACT